MSDMGLGHKKTEHISGMQVADSRAPIPKSPNASELQNVLLVEKRMDVF